MPKKQPVRILPQKLVAPSEPESKIDEEFALAFTPTAMVRHKNALYALLHERGAKEMNSSKGWGEDRVAAAASEDFERSTDLAMLMKRASPEMVRALRIAYSAGAAWIEARAYKIKALGRGAPRKREKILQAIEAAFHQWRADKGNREPRAKDLLERYRGPALRKLTNFQNYVSVWQKDRPLRRAKKS